MNSNWIDEHKKLFIIGLVAISFIIFIVIIVLILVNWRILAAIGLVALFVGIPVFFQTYFKKLYYFTKNRNYYPNKNEIDPLIQKYKILVAVIVVETFVNPPTFYFVFKRALNNEDIFQIDWLSQLDLDIAPFLITLIAAIPFIIGSLIFHFVNKKYDFVGEKRIETRLKETINNAKNSNS
ncbi:hypothetical protein NEF87_002081 [Candidatus Lokiarchaeum ossiferum]|uniref:Uncharacterized protein n=1 Tax=Candidatus Lokiarchaeum ossiferum TaxID=2951803 RepID=A0ABY6HTB9_9ARCH|nr:hypothetical protein NEF87_002081 [Candidatus Lokiarchaeum sp. B-35]